MFNLLHFMLVLLFLDSCLALKHLHKFKFETDMKTLMIKIQFNRDGFPLCKTFLNKDFLLLFIHSFFLLYQLFPIEDANSPLEQFVKYRMLKSNNKKSLKLTKIQKIFVKHNWCTVSRYHSIRMKLETRTHDHAQDSPRKFKLRMHDWILNHPKINNKR